MIKFDTARILLSTMTGAATMLIALGEGADRMITTGDWLFLVGMTYFVGMFMFSVVYLVMSSYPRRRTSYVPTFRSTEPMYGTNRSRKEYAEGSQTTHPSPTYETRPLGEQGKTQ